MGSPSLGLEILHWFLWNVPIEVISKALDSFAVVANFVK